MIRVPFYLIHTEFFVLDRSLGFRVETINVLIFFL